MLPPNGDAIARFVPAFAEMYRQNAYSFGAFTSLAAPKLPFRGLRPQMLL